MTPVMGKAGVPSFAGFAHTIGWTTTRTVAELLLATGSVDVVETLAVFAIIAAVAGAVTVIATVAVALKFTVPSGQLIGAVPVQGPPWLGVADTSVTPAGSVSVTDVCCIRLAQI